MKTESLLTQKSSRQHNFTADSKIISVIHVVADSKIISSDGVVSSSTPFL
jgi:hypothetical protein